MTSKMELLILGGFFLIFLGFVLVFAGSLLSSAKGAVDKDSKVAVGGFIGPIPFGFANTPGMYYVLIGALVFMFIVWVVLRSVRG